MCGIAGIVHSDQHLTDSEAVVVAMRDSLRHRGPDDAGHYVGPGIALASRRLAILDLSQRGHMPMCSRDGRYRGGCPIQMERQAKAESQSDSTTAVHG